jgi:hypothetical protein
MLKVLVEGPHFENHCSGGREGYKKLSGAAAHDSSEAGEAIVEGNFAPCHID